ncbi:hypothetical protein, partial [Roseibium sp.]|uniref:hypothetical protein n=1 Tax=Roseibium sp. TaxID=1936156 RepID=UPI003296EC45
MTGAPSTILPTEDDRPVIVIRHLNMMTFAAALAFKATGRRIIYLEPSAELRTSAWSDRIDAAGLEHVNLHASRGYEVNADIFAAQKYAGAVLSLSLDPADIGRLAEELGVPDQPMQKARSIIYQELQEIFLPHCRSYALAEYFRARGIVADVIEDTGIFGVFLSDRRVTKVRNFHAWPSTGWVALTRRIWGKLAHQLHPRPAAPATLGDRIRPEPAAPPTDAKPVLYFTHKGPQYGRLFLKDQYYATDINSPFHTNNILHVEQAWLLNKEEAALLRRQFADHGLQATFIDIPGFSGRAFAKALQRHLTFGARFRIGFAKALLLASLSVRLQRTRAALRVLAGARLALVDNDMLFPTISVAALQSLGITVAGLQSRFMSAFLPLTPVLFDTYFVHGEFVRRRLEKQTYACPGAVHVTGDPQYEKILKYREGAASRRVQEFPTFKKICLVLDLHSLTDKYDNALFYGTDWESNAFFYAAIARLARANPDCRFLIRGKNTAWLDVPALATAVKEFDELPNVTVDQDYTEFDRTYALAAMSDLIIGRYTSACDQCLAVGIPVLVFEGMPNGHNQLIGVCHNYKPYPIFIGDEKTLHRRFRETVWQDLYMPDDMFADLRQDYYAVDIEQSPASPKARLMAALQDLYDATSPPTPKTMATELD